MIPGPQFGVHQSFWYKQNPQIAFLQLWEIKKY